MPQSPAVATSIALSTEALTGPMRDDVQQVAQDDARVLLTRDGQPVAAIVSLSDLRALEELDEVEDVYLFREAAEAVARWQAEGRPAGISHEALAPERGVDLTDPA